MLEDANVQAVEETVRLTELMRSYQNAAQLISRVEEVESRAVRDLSRIPN
jgi:flagellar basal body rod protein FlgG